MLGLRTKAPVLCKVRQHVQCSAVEERMPKQDKTTYSFMKVSALSGFVSFASEITRKPASPPSRRPSSTSTRTPQRAARSTCGRARAIFSSSVYQMMDSIQE